jgi:hypothetical protein
VAENLTADVQSVYDRLFELSPGQDEDGDPTPVFVELIPEAKGLFVDFFNRHGQEQAALDDDLAAAWAKLEAYAPRLALVHHLIRLTTGTASGDKVDEISMQAGIDLAEWFGGEAKQIYALLDLSVKEEDRLHLLDLISRIGGKVTSRELAKVSRRFDGSSELADSALAELVTAGLGVWEYVDTTPHGGRPSRVFRLN